MLISLGRDRLHRTLCKGELCSGVSGDCSSRCARVCNVILPVLCQDEQGAAGASLLDPPRRSRVLLEKC